MAGNQLPVLTLDIDESKIKELNDISEKFKAAFAVGPGGFSAPSAYKPPSTSTQGSKKNDADFTSGIDKFFKELNKEAQATAKTFGVINKTLAATTNTLKGLFTTTVSWGAKIAAVGVAGPLGYGYMANRVAEQYRTPQGMNISTGQMQAASNVYGTRISGTENIMQSLAAAQNNPSDSHYSGLMSLGINPEEGAAANLPKLLAGVTGLLKQYKGTGVSQAVLQSHGLGWIGVDQANQMLANSERIPQLNQQFAEQSAQLDNSMGAGTELLYQDTSANLAHNMDRIGNTFLKAVANLNGPITKLSDSMTASIEKFLSGPNGKAVFDTVADGLQKLGSWLSSDEFQQDLKTFADCVNAVIKSMGGAIKWIADNVPGISLPGSGDGGEGSSSVNPWLLGGGAYAGAKFGGLLGLGGMAGAGWGAYGAYLYSDRENIESSAQSSWNYTKRNVGDALRWMGMDTDYGRNPNSVMGTPQAAMDIPGNELPRGIRNNNPGNLNFANQYGASMENHPNARFAQFPTMLHGIAALDKQVALYMKRGKNTIGQIIDTYAPEEDNNNTDAYKKYLSQYTGIGINETLNSSNNAQIMSLLKGIINHENGAGASAISQDDILRAMAMNRAGQMPANTGTSQQRVTVDISQQPGSDINAQVQGIYLPQR